MTFSARIKLMLGAGRSDFHGSGVWQKVGLLATATWLAYEWGPGNETVTPLLAASVMNRTDGVAGALLVGAAAGIFTFAQQFASGTTVAWTASTFPALARQGFDLFMTDGEGAGDSDGSPWVRLPLVERLLTAFTLGASYVVVRELIATGRADGRHLTAQAARCALLSASMVALLGGGLDALTLLAEGTPAEEPVDTLVRIAANPWVWLGALTTWFVVKWARRRIILRDTDS